ncbi:phage holin family protein [Nocardia xishanensis]|uniref:Phage holin family protein n=1 Tax=Nocardia xishanensis TaxID=238964 RepID=A0ABW7WV07_9NOCA|nr:phage holin family protein [Nocardia xishanensis]
MFWNDDDRQRNRTEEWAGATIVFGILLVLAIVLAILVSTADFGDRSRPTTPRTPGSCQPFCTVQPTPS